MIVFFDLGYISILLKQTKNHSIVYEKLLVASSKFMSTIADNKVPCPARRPEDDLFTSCPILAVGANEHSCTQKEQGNRFPTHFYKGFPSVLSETILQVFVSLPLSVQIILPLKPVTA